MQNFSQKMRPALLDMEIGTKIDFPIEKMKSVRAQASELGLIHARRYSTCIDRAHRVIIVTRVE